MTDRQIHRHTVRHIDRWSSVKTAIAAMSFTNWKAFMMLTQQRKSHQ